MYTTTEALIERYGEEALARVTYRQGAPADAINLSVAGRAMVDADALIDGYLAARYALPLASTPPLLADLAQAITFYKLHIFTCDQKVKDDHDAALRQLQAIATGTIRLPFAGIEPAGAVSSGVEVVDRERPFTADNLRGFI